METINAPSWLRITKQQDEECPNMPRNHPDEAQTRELEPDNTGDQIPWKLAGLLVTIGGLIVALVGGYIGAWRGGNQAALRDAEWRGSIRQSLDQINFQLIDITKSANKAEAILAQHEGRLTKIELTGSPNLKDLRAELVARLDQFETVLRQHIIDTRLHFGVRSPDTADPTHKP